ncbi:MAG: toxin-activating lysine-acyltransferase, partial [Rhizobiales bacterium]|nr:toxin-activating lysine-acyltransferase [Hyphomicrobiales bacterium]
FSILIGDILRLWLVSNKHRSNNMLLFETLCMPPIHLNQFRIYRHNGRPIGYVVWAFLTEELGKQYIVGDFDFKSEYWNSGDQLWFIDVIAPYGHIDQIRHDLQHNIFPDKIAYAPWVSQDGKSYRVRRFHGVNRSPCRGVNK